MSQNGFLQDWIDSLSEPRTEFGGSPACPWAARAGIAVFTFPSQMSTDHFLYHLNEVLPRCVLILRVPPAVRVPEHRRRSWIALESDPQNPVIISGFRTTHQGNGKLILIQNRAELLSYRKVLESKGYFANWSPSDLEKIGVEG